METTTSPCDETALLLGQTVSFQNYTSYEKGINGIMVDFADLAHPDQLNTETDFRFRVGNTDEPGAWLPAPAHDAVLERESRGESSRTRVRLAKLA